MPRFFAAEAKATRTRRQAEAAEKHSDMLLWLLHVLALAELAFVRLEGAEGVVPSVQDTIAEVQSLPNSTALRGMTQRLHIRVPRYEFLPLVPHLLTDRPHKTSHQQMTELLTSIVLRRGWAVVMEVCGGRNEAFLQAVRRPDEDRFIEADLDRQLPVDTLEGLTAKSIQRLMTSLKALQQILALRSELEESIHDEMRERLDDIINGRF